MPYLVFPRSYIRFRVFADHNKLLPFVLHFSCRPCSQFLGLASKKQLLFPDVQKISPCIEKKNIYIFAHSK